MDLDCIIIGGGIAGLSCGIKCAKEGLRVAVISSGMSALHFSSGCIDVLGRRQANAFVKAPFDELPDFAKSYPEHPYAKTGPVMEEALSFFSHELACEGAELVSNGRENHLHITPFGTLKPTFLSPQGDFLRHLKKGPVKNKIAVLTFDGYRDFHPGLAAANLAGHELFSNCEFVTGSVPLPPLRETPENQYEFRSIDIARIFDLGKHIEEIAGAVKKQARDADIVILPACIGIDNHREAFSKLSRLAGRQIYEVPTLPPSIAGMRLDAALKKRFAALGGVFVSGDRVVSGDVSDRRVTHVCTQERGAEKISARFFVLATGSFFSGGMASRFDGIFEPVFHLALAPAGKRNLWYAQKFFDEKSHPFLEFGVETNAFLNPRNASGKTLENLFCAGAILAHYNPVKEASGGGVAVGTGYFAALRIIAECEKTKKTPDL